MQKEFDYDVVIIGAGVIGSAIARELSGYQLKTCVLEKEEDVCSGTSKANSAIVHAGFDAMPGTRKAELNLHGNERMESLSKELDFEFKRNGAMVLCFREEDRPVLAKLYERGIANGVPGISILSGDKARQMEPELSDDVVAVLYAPGSGIVCPFGLTIALAENACENGVEYKMNTTVQSIKKHQKGFWLKTDKSEISSRYVVNAAGVYADIFHNMVSERKLYITARKGEYCLLDKAAGSHVSHTVFQLPGKYGKGILVTPTVHGNLLLGPTACDVEEKEDTSTTAEGLEEVIYKASLGVKHIPMRQVITSFSGLRAHEEGDDFVIGEPEDAEGFFDAAGIESPGLSCAPAIGEALAFMIADKAGVERKENAVMRRKAIPQIYKLPPEEQARLIKERPDYGTIVCRCENISEGEITDAIHRKPGAVSMDGIKRRVRQGMGRCQAGFCTPKAMEILARELKKDITEICKNACGSELLTGEE